MGLKLRDTRGKLLGEAILEFWKVWRNAPVLVGHALIADVLTLGPIHELVRARARDRLISQRREVIARLRIGLAVNRQHRFRAAGRGDEISVRSGQSENELIVIDDLDILDQ